MKFNELHRRLIRAGCYIARPGGKHNIWYSPITGKYVRLGHHGASKEVPPDEYHDAKKNLLGA